MFSRIRANLTLKPLMDILNENGTTDLSKFESRHINGYIGYKFRSKSIGLPVEGVYEVTVTRDPFAYNVSAELGYGDALYILCISPDCKNIIGRFSIPELNIYKEGKVSGKDASDFIQIFKLMYDKRDKNSQGYMNCKYNVSDIKRYHLQAMLSCRTIVIKDQKNRRNTTISPMLNKITLEKQNRTGREKDMIVFSSKGKVNITRVEINIEEIVQITNQSGQLHIETYEARIFENIVDTVNNAKPSIKNRYNLYKPDTSNNINTNVVKNDTALPIDNKHNRLTKEDEQEIKKDLSNLYSCKIIIIKDRKKDTTINLDKRLIEVNYVRGDITGKMILTITSSSGVNKRKIEIYFENIINLTKHNFRFTIDASEVMVYKL